MNKFLIQMVRLTFLLSILFMMHSSYASSQNLKNTIVSLNENNATLVQIFNEITNITNFNFTYSSYITENEERFDAEYQKQSLEYVLTDLGKKAGFSYQVSGKDIMIAEQEVKIGFTSSTMQQRTVTGRVTDTQGLPLPNANVIEKGTSNGVITDMDGAFEIDVTNKDAVLIVSFIGFISKEITVGDQTIIEVVLQEDEAKLDEVVIIGYGVQDKRDITTSIASVKSKDLENQPVVGFDQAIAAKMAGVRVVEPSGEPGVGMRIQVRGLSSISAGNNPLYVIDGVPINTDFQNAGGNLVRDDNGGNAYQVESINALSSININDIESIEVLKDASAAAIYGSRGSNGVVLITTKKGASGKPKVSYDAYFGISEVINKVDVMDAYQYAEILKEGHDNTYLDVFPDGSPNDNNDTRRANGSPNGGLIPDYIIPYLENQPGLTNTDWQDEIFRTASVQSHNLSFSGGKGPTNYFASLNYTQQEGVVINSDYELLSARLNLNTKVSEKVDFGFNLNPSFENYNRIRKGPHFNEGIIALALGQQPVFPVYNPDGSYNWDGNGQDVRSTGNAAQLNPVALANEIQNETSHMRLLGNTYTSFKIIDDLYYKISLGFDINNFKRDYFRPSTLESRTMPGEPSIPQGFQRNDEFTNFIIENTLSYNKSFGEHSFNAVAVYSAQQEEQRFLEVRANEYPNDLISTTNAGQVSSAGGQIEEWSLVSILGRVQYDYMGKYLVSAAVRSDGSSRFGSNNRWGTFPSVSAGWRVSNESFWASNLVSDLKLRASYGVTGNFQIPNYGSTSLISQTNYVDDSGAIINGLSQLTSSNPDLQWETTKTFDVGVDLGLFKDQLYLELDYYVSNTEDLLLNVPVPETSGFSSILTNIGEVQNKGFEATLSGRARLGELEIDASLNFATNQNEIIALGPDDNDIITTIPGGAGYPFIARVGEEIGSYYALQVTGVLSQEDIDNGIPVWPGSQAGDIKNLDVNGDGVITDDGDRTIVGNPNPDYTLGFNTTLKYRNFDFGFAIQSVQGFEVNALNNRYFYNIEGNFNNHVDALNRYVSEDNPGNGVVPRANRSTKGSLGRPSSWHVEDGSYVRIRNITVGYTLPSTIKFLDRARVYAAAQNPFLFTNYRYYNPEVSSTPDNALTGGQDYGNYPLARTFSLGINLTFK